MNRFSFPANYKLKSRKAIESLYTNKGNSIFSHPILLKFEYLPEINQETQTRFAFSVSKKAFPNATDRNTIKRKLRESFRLKYHENFPSHSKIQLNGMFIFIEKELCQYDEIENAMIKVLRKLQAFVAKV